MFCQPLAKVVALDFPSNKTEIEQNPKKEKIRLSLNETPVFTERTANNLKDSEKFPHEKCALKLCRMGPISIHTYKFRFFGSKWAAFILTAYFAEAATQSSKLENGSFYTHKMHKVVLSE